MLSFLKKIWKKTRAFLLFIAIALGVGALSALLTEGSMAEFSALKQPPLSPPGWLFPIVWTALFVLMGVSAAMVWKSSRGEIRSGALFLWAVQLFVNFFWTIIFFRFEYRLFAFFWLLLLLLLVSAMTLRFYRINKAAGWMQLPYILWLLFAGYLNLGIYLLNR